MVFRVVWVVCFGVFRCLLRVLGVFRLHCWGNFGCLFCCAFGFGVFRWVGWFWVLGLSYVAGFGFSVCGTWVWDVGSGGGCGFAFVIWVLVLLRFWVLVLLDFV